MLALADAKAGRGRDHNDLDREPKMDDSGDRYLANLDMHLEEVYM